MANLVDTSALNYYRPAELVIPSHQTKDQRWYIKFYVFDKQQNRVVKKRFYKIPAGRNTEHRRFLAMKMIEIFNQDLKNGKIIDRYEGIEENIKFENQHNLAQNNVGVITAINSTIQAKNFTEERTAQTYKGLFNSLKNYLQMHEPMLPIGRFDEIEATNFVRWLSNNNKSPRTINNHILTFRTLWDQAIALKYVTHNPWKQIKRLKTPVGKNIAYLPNQQKEILDFAASRYPSMEFLIKFMYYTLARTNEIAHLQIKHIGMYVPDKIYLEASVSKNDVERHIIIPPGLEAEFQKRGIRSLNPDWYIFSQNKLNPGPKRMQTKYLGTRFREWILNKLNYPKDYTLYSWKHTGVIAAHKAGVSDDDIMKQTGHKDYGSFQKYLKSLGLYDNQDFATKIPTI